MRPIYNKPAVQHPKSAASKTTLRVQGLLKEAVDLHQKGALDEALALYKSVLSIESKNFEALHLSGLIAYQTQNPAKGVELMGQALKINPQSLACMVNLGLAEHATGDLASASSRYQKALSLKKDFAQAHYNLANVYKDQSNWQAAIVGYENAISLKPDYTEALVNLANVLEVCQRLENARLCLNRVLFINPYLSRAYNNRGNVNKKLERWRDAVNDYDTSIQLDQEYTDAYVNKANLLKDLGYWEAADTCYTKSLQLDPNHSKAVWNKSLLNLLLGHFEQGWIGYEARWRAENAQALNLNQNAQLLVNPCRQWRGLEPIRGKRLLVFAEQGLGDSIQFVRFIPRLETMGAIVYLVVQRPLLALFAQVTGVSQLSAMDEELPECELCCPLMSLPLALGALGEQSFEKTAYLVADSIKTLEWQQRLRESIACAKPFLVGIAWRGSIYHANDKFRSLSYELFMDSLKDCFQEFLPTDLLCVNLQKELLENERACIKEDRFVADYSEFLTDFSQTAALCSQLDLIICVDTSVAHLAAAMGQEVWVLLPFSPDWRWQLNKVDSVWYEKVRLYRQSVWNDWTAPLQSVKKDLRDRLNRAKGNTE